MHVPVIQAISGGGTITVRISSPNFPQTVAGKVWRYNADKTKNGIAGIFTSEAPDVPLGAPALVKGKLFLIQGAVLHYNDNPPTPYQVVVTVQQGETVLHEAVPDDNGAGQIGIENISFTYRFQLEVIRAGML